MRAVKLTPVLHFRVGHEPNWMAHTPVGHDSVGWMIESLVQSLPQLARQILNELPGDAA